LGAPGKPLAQGREHPRARLDQHDLRVLGVDRAEIGRERHPGELDDGARHLDPGRSGADDHEGEQPPPLGRVVGHLGALEREQHALADLGGVRDLLQSRGHALPLVAAEVGVPGAGGEDEVVVSHAPVVEDHLARSRVDAADLAHLHRHVGLAAEDGPDRPSDVGGRQGGGGDLVEQGLEQVVVAAVDQHDLGRRARQRLSRGEAAEAGPDDDHAGPAARVDRRHVGALLVGFGLRAASQGASVAGSSCCRWLR
jgi:hypothetical protein